MNATIAAASFDLPHSLPAAKVLEHLLEAWKQEHPSSQSVLLSGGGEPSALNAWHLLGVGECHRLQVFIEEGSEDKAAQAIIYSDGAKREALPLADLPSLHQRLESLALAQSAGYPSAAWEATFSHLPCYLPCFAFYAYEAYRLFEPHLQPLVSSTEALPLLEWVWFETLLLSESHSQTLYCLGGGGDIQTWVAAQLPTLLPPPKASPILPDASLAEALAGYTLSLPEAAFESQVQAIQEAIVSGELYQANLSTRFERRLDAPLEPLTLLKALRLRNPSPFAALWEAPWGQLACNSPERLVSVQQDVIATRPIAGTRGRGATPEADAALASSLLQNEKERAEHLMLVDLERNDLGKLCLVDSVRVDELLVIERYSHVQHLVSNVVGRLPVDTSLLAVVAALFPGGTITGCPKLRCIDILHRLEPFARGVYTGSLGYCDWNTGRMDLNIIIRSVLQHPLPTGDARVSFQAGAGIVQDSSPAAEFKESLKKAAALLITLEQISK